MIHRAFLPLLLLIGTGFIPIPVSFGQIVPPNVLDKIKKPEGKIDLAKLPLNGEPFRPLRVLGDSRFRHADTITQILPLNAKQFLTTSRDGTARLWDSESGKEVYRLHHQPGNDVWNIQVVDEKHLISCGSQTICIWDRATGKKFKTIKPGGNVLRLCVVPGQRKFVTAGPGAKVQLWDIETGKTIRSYRGHRDDVYDVRITADAKRLITGGSGEIVIVYDLKTGEKLATLEDHDDSIVTIAIHSDQNQFLTSSDDASIRCWSLKNYTETWAASLADEVTVVQWSSDGKRVIATCADGNLYELNGEDGEVLRKIETPSNYSWAVSYFGKDSKILSGGDNLVQAYDARTGKILFPDLSQPNCKIALGQTAGFAIDDKNGVVHSCAADGILRVTKLDTGEQLRTVIPANYDRKNHGVVANVDFQLDEGLAAILTEDAGVIVVKIDNGETVCEYHPKDGDDFDTVYGGWLVDRGQKLLVYDYNDEVKLISCKTGRVVQSLNVATDDQTIEDVVSLSGGDRFAIVMTESRQVDVFDSRNAKKLFTYNMRDEAFSVFALSAAGETILHGSADNSLMMIGSARDRNVKPGSDEDIRNWIDDLSSRSYQVRTNAVEKLLHGGDRTLKMLKGMKSDDREVEFRIRQIRNAIEKLDLPTKALGKGITFDDSIADIAISERGDRFAMILGTHASAEIIFGKLTPAGPELLARATDGNSPQRIQFARDGQQLVVSNRNGTVSVYRINDVAENSANGASTGQTRKK